MVGDGWHHVPSILAKADIASDVSSYTGAHSISSQALKGVGVKLTISFRETTSFRFVRRKS